jgi:hypothetical protein
MSPVALSSLLTIAALGVSLATAQITGTYPAVPLASKHYDSPAALPEKVDTDQGLIRGTQLGYNICNSTTENQNSLCQTSYFNSPSDFCLWAPSKPDSTIADTEGEEVAWCSQPGHGTRLIPAGALTGLQYLKTPDYIQIVGFIDQTKINIASGDYGGELDPHGADLRGNPMGGVMFSSAWTGSLVQVIEWTNFMGGNAFCMKACDPSKSNAANYCQHVFDRIGCAYNAPNNAKDKVFESCDADNADFPGVYTSAGKTVTYTQPPESLGAISSMPYTARIPASSNCKTLTSSALFTALPTVSATSSSARATGSLATVKSKAATATGSGASATSSSSTTSDGTVLAISGMSFLGIVFSALFLA